MGEALSILLDNVNDIVGELVKIVFLDSLFSYWIYSTVKNFQEERRSRGLYLSVIAFVLLLFPLFGVIILPQIIALVAACNKTRAYMTVGVLRWFALFATLCPLVLVTTFKYSKFKSSIMLCRHLCVLLLGWFIGRWFGIVFIALPILIIFYFRLYHLAQVVFPASDPEAKDEKNNKFWALFWYVWGAQYPIWVAQGSATRKIDERISGDYFKDFGHPGLVWMYSHQVVGQSVGVEFNNVYGPGIIFTEQYERPVAIVDLRTQLRPTQFEAVTRDGISIRVIIFISFKIDQDDWGKWDKEERHRIWRVSPILQSGLKPDKNINSSYPYSTARVHAVLSTVSIDPSEDDNPSPKVYWDEIVVQRVIKEARLVLSERTFDELWVPKEDEIGEIAKKIIEGDDFLLDTRDKSALDEIAIKINEKAAPRLKEIGVALFASRVVNFVIDEDDPLREQLLSMWIASWEKKIKRIELEGETEAEKLRSQARAAARHAFLETITESLANARNINNDLPKQVVALNFIATLQGVLKDTDIEDTNQQAAKLEIWKQFLLRNNRGDRE